MIRRSPLLLLILMSGLTLSCRQDMHDQPRFEPLEKNSFFADGRASRPLVAGTVARGQLRLDKHLYEGRVEGELAPTFPFPITADVLRRGRQRYDIFCSPCHDVMGTGQGMIVQRGFRAPTSFHIDRLRRAAPGHFFDVISNGLGAMYDYADRVPVHDRWAITAYIRALQLSQNTAIEDVSDAAREHLRSE